MQSRLLATSALLLALIASAPAYAVTPGYVGGWGSDAYGQLGNSYKDGFNAFPSLEWTDVTSGLHRAIAVDTGDANTIAIAKDGSVWVWGKSDGAGNGTLGDVVVPTQKSDLSGTFIAVRAGGSSGDAPYPDHTGYGLALRSDGTVWSWGAGQYGNLGDGLLHGVETAARQVVGLSNVTDVAAGEAHALAVSGGHVFAWGAAAYGELGDGISFGHLMAAPFQVAGLTNVVSVSAGWSHSLAVKSDGTLWGWGDGRAVAGTGDPLLAPVQVPIPCTVTAASAGLLSSLALCSNGTVWAWGINYEGQLGDGTYDWNGTPTQVPGLSGVIQIATGRQTAIALEADGDVWTWGGNGAGALGDGTFDSNRPTPTRVVNGSSSSEPQVWAVAAGGLHMAVLADPNPILIAQPVNLDDSILKHFGPLDLLGPGPLPITGVSVTTPFASLLFGIDSPDPFVSDGTVYPTGSPCPSSCGVQLSLPPAAGSVPGPVSGTLTVQFADGSQQQLAVQGQVRSSVVTVCYDGIDNDGDGYTDLDDPACSSGYPPFPDGTRTREASQCQNGLNDDNDASGLIDFDGGQSIYGQCADGTCPPGVSDPNHDGIADRDPQCADKPWKNKETASTCGLGIELLALFPLLQALRRRRRG